MSDTPAIENTNHSAVHLTNISHPHSRYTDIKPLANGGSAEIFELTDKKLGMTVAAKRVDVNMKNMNPVLFDQLVNNLKNEASLQAKLHHPAIVITYDLATDNDNNVYMIMKDLRNDGYTNVAELANNDQLEVSDMVTILQEMNDVLDFLQKQRPPVYHRDLKLNNIMYNRDADNGIHVKLLDFGIANVVDTTDRSTTVMATPSYMTPEFVREVKETEATDEYSLALIACALVNKKTPHTEFGRAPRITEQLYRDTMKIIPSNVPMYYDTMQQSLKKYGIDEDQFLRTINRALERNPDDRFETRKEFLKELFRSFPKST